jgi:hypothetical protein
LETETNVSRGRAIQGVWLIERTTGRNLVAKAYTKVNIDMDLIAPFLSATHTFIDKASNEKLSTIDTETNRYVWQANEWLLLVLVVSKSARPAHMRFLLEYAMGEFMRREIPQNTDIESMLKRWPGVRDTFRGFEEFLDELIQQYEETDECLEAGKSMDSLAIYSHLYRAILRVKVAKTKRKKMMDTIRENTQDIIEVDPALSAIDVSADGVEVLGIDVYQINYRLLRSALEKILSVIAEAAKSLATEKAYREMIFTHVMTYVKRDVKRLETYHVLDDVIRSLF